MPRILMERSGEMEVFVKVVQEGAFSGAARRLGLTPSAVSKLIARLENRLGARLFVRTTRVLTLTEDGNTFYRAAQRILQDIHAAEEAAAAGAVRGNLRVTASVPFGSMYVAPAVSSFLNRHRDVIVDLSFTDDVVDLFSQRADVAVRMGNLPDSSLVAKKLGQTRRIVCASPRYLKQYGTPKSPSELPHHECLTFNFRRTSVWPFKSGDISVSGYLRVNNGETMRQLTLAGVGIARLGVFHVAADIKAGTLVPLLEKFNPGDLELIHAVYVGGGHVPRRVRAFIDHLAEGLARVKGLH
jgi:DNA-binding transcriptional LysR family regulator